MIRKGIKRIYDILTLKDYRAEIVRNQQKQVQATTLLYEQLFSNNPVLVLSGVKIFLPLFYSDHIQKIIFSNRDFYEKETLLYLKSKYGSFAHILDIGSNIGNHMLFFCSHLQAKKVYCFEPNQYNFNVLSRNVELNNLEKTVMLHKVAAGSKTGKGVEKNFTLMNTGINRVETVTEENIAETQVDIVCIDDYGYGNIDFVKIDVEGFELEVLKGAAQTLQRSNAVVMIEVFEENQELVDEIMLAFNYTKTVTLEDFNIIYEKRRAGE